MKRKTARRNAAALLIEHAGGRLDCAIVLGSGLGESVGARTSLAGIPYAKLAGMPTQLVPGHPGIALAGRMAGRRVVVFAGRFHLYQGYDARDVVYPVVVAAAAGARTVILTNAAGGLNPAYGVGDVMLIADQLNLTGMNPFTGTRRAQRGAAFVDMTDAYAPALRAKAHEVALGQGLRAHAGIYAGVAGPAFETPAETRMLRTLGADAVGMSTVHEAIAARAYGLHVLGICLITNAAGATASGTHETVLDVARSGGPAFEAFLEGIVATLSP